MSGGFYVVYQDDGFYTDFTEPKHGVRGTDWDEFPDMISAMRGGYARASYVVEHTTGFKAVHNGKTRKYKTAAGAMAYKHKNPEAEVYREVDGEWRRIL